MRREQKNALKELHLTHIFSRWLQYGCDNDEQSFKEFMMATEATPHEMKLFRIALADRMIAHIENITNAAMRVRHPSLNSLIQKRRLMDFYKTTPKALLTTRKDDYDTCVNWLTEFYEDRIVELVRKQYYALFHFDRVAPERIFDRIYNNTDAGYVDRDGTVMGWHRIDARLEAIVREWVDYERRLAANKRPPSSLKAFVADKQNIHTTAVNNQTRDTLTLLFATPVPAEQRTLHEIDEMWANMSIGSHVVINDIRTWAGKSMIVEPDDYLYRKTLRSLWAKIKTCGPELQKELAKRLYEECRDALGMCAQGHISRLANVFVGFDAAFKAPASEKELLQEKMADISRQEIAEEEKRTAAAIVLNEFKVPEPDRVAWLEAF